MPSRSARTGHSGPPSTQAPRSRVAYDPPLRPCEASAAMHHTGVRPMTEPTPPAEPARVPPSQPEAPEATERTTADDAPAARTPEDVTEPVALDPEAVA